MNQTTRIILVRHGEAEHNRDGFIGGHSDTRLTEQGKQQALEAKASLNEFEFDEVYSSDLSRAVETASIIYGEKVPANHRLEELRERSYGELELKPYEMLEPMNARQATLSGEELWNYKHVSDIESDLELANRVIVALNKIASDNSGKTILVVSHGGSIRLTLIKLGYMTHKQLVARSFKNAGYVELESNGHSITVKSGSGVDKKIAKP